MMTNPLSLRTFLSNQGVTSEVEMKKHLDFVYKTLQGNPLYDWRSYKVTDNGTTNQG
jgi:hypothetical protein